MGSLGGIKLIDAVAAFVKSEAFTKPMNAFVEQECTVFESPEAAWPVEGQPRDTGEGFSLALSQVHAAYGKLASDLIENHLTSLGANWDRLQQACTVNARAPSTKVVRNALEAVADFPFFFTMMAEKNLELEAKALELWHLQTQFGFDEDDLQVVDEVQADEEIPELDFKALALEYGLSETTLMELQAARAEASAAGGSAAAEKAESMLAALDEGEEASSDDGVDFTYRPEDDEDADATDVSGVASLASVGKATGTAGAKGGSKAAPSIEVTGTATIDGATRPAGAGERRASKVLTVDAPPSPKPRKQAAGDDSAAEHVPSVVAPAGPLSAPAKTATATSSSPRVSKPGDPDYDENSTLQIGRSRWKIGRQIGRGATARVFLAVDMDQHRTFAVKQILVAGQNATDLAALAELEREIAVMRKLAHPNLVRYLGTERTDEELYIAMEYVRGGALADLIKRIAAQQARQRQQRAQAEAAAGGESAGPPAHQIVLPLRTIASYTAQVLSGLAYLHEKEVIHRDIKSANILVDATYQHVKVADFGSAKMMETGAGFKTDGAQTLKGTPFWMSPEVIQGTGYGRKADIWSVGCVCIEMLTGRPPWADQLGDKAHPYAIMYHIVNANTAPDYPTVLPAPFKAAMGLMFERDTSKRPTAAQLLEHDWLKDSMPPTAPEPPAMLRQEPEEDLPSLTELAKQKQQKK